MITNIDLEIRGKKISLTMEELRELKAALAQLFPERVYYPVVYPVAPMPPYNPWRGPCWTSQQGENVVQLKCG